jgi:hypothetical protein
MQQPFGSHYHTWCAKATLRSTMADKGLFKGFQEWVVFLFDGDYLPAICLQGQNETGCNSITVKEHGTGTTFSRTASFLYLSEAVIS